MLTATQIGGFAGAGLAGAAYVPQISHLIRARCSAGISRLAFGVWLLSSLLITARAVAIGAGVFIVLGAIQIMATALITVLAARSKDAPCPVHRSRQPAVRTVTGTGTSGPSLVPGVRPATWLLNQPPPSGAAGPWGRISPSWPCIPMTSPDFKRRT
jgi:PQ loop repeat